jgi:hypothetical protein
MSGCQDEHPKSGGPSCGVPMRRRARMDRWVGLSPEQYGVDLKPATGGLAEQASNTARGTPKALALRDCYLLCTQKLTVHRVMGRLRPGVPRALEIFRAAKEENYGRTRPYKQYGRRGYAFFILPREAGKGDHAKHGGRACEPRTRSAEKKNESQTGVRTGAVVNSLPPKPPPPRKRAVPLPRCAGADEH